mmetsp:Transcript_3739/g.8048  ORF Transcript_3739/g.8048 Transcript_3739/m.8048 type:complete len:204 (+) Transcript_3739:1844-2455(+)
MWLTSQLIDFLDGNCVDFVVQIQGRFVFAITEGDIYELIDGDFFSRQYVGADNFVLAKNLRDDLFGFGSEFRLDYRARESHSPSQFSLAYRDIGRTLVETNADGFQLSFQDLSMAVQSLLSGVQDNKNSIGISGYSNDFLSSSCSMGGTLNDTGKIQNLHLASLVTHHARNARQSRKLVSCGFGLGRCQCAQEGRFPNGRKSN